MVGKGDSSAPSSSYQSEPYVKKDPSNFPPPPRTKRYGEGETPTAPEPPSRYIAAGDPSLPVRNRAEDDEGTYETGPFVANKTGIDTTKYPEPPGRRSGLASPPAPPAPPQTKPKPSLPPRLPPRNESSAPTTSEQRASSGYLNQGALNRLGTSGINVAGFGMGSGGKAPGPPPLPSRSSGGSPSPLPATGGTTWAEKQAALKTANQLRTNPNTVSLSEIRGAAATANNFQVRHGDQVASGMQTAQQVNQKYGLAGKVGHLSGASGKAPPPPPPAKKFHGAPPPIPAGSKPKPT
jgi:hypothetical protein